MWVVSLATCWATVPIGDTPDRTSLAARRIRAIKQIVNSKVAATRTTTDPTSIQTRQAAQRSASVIAVLPGRAAVEVITSITRTIAPPEPILLARRSAGLLGSHVLPHAVEELD